MNERRGISISLLGADGEPVVKAAKEEEARVASMMSCKYCRRNVAMVVGAKEERGDLCLGQHGQ